MALWGRKKRLVDYASWQAVHPDGPRHEVHVDWRGLGLPRDGWAGAFVGMRTSGPHAAGFILLANEQSGGLADRPPTATASRRSVAGRRLRCALPHRRFSIRDGTYLDEDKPRRDARPYPVRLVGDQVQVAVPDGPEGDGQDQQQEPGRIR